jgi:dihydroorotate dehydrogenase electron transfer subunit
LTPAIFRLDLEAPEIAEAIRPGQFVMIRSASGDDPLLGRPLAVYDVQRDASGKATSLSVVFQVFGKGTARLSQMREGDQVRIWGPLGHPFETTPPPGNIWFVAGGIGYTPFLALSKWWNGQGQFGPPIESPQNSRNIDFLYGVRNASLIPPLEEFQNAGMNLEICTEDGSKGHKGRVTDLMTQRINTPGEPRPGLIVACGPEPMLAAVSKWSENHGLKCWVSLENQMACGFGACFSCVAPIRQSDGSVDLRRVCLEGPIFDSTDVAWHS